MQQSWSLGTFWPRDKIDGGSHGLQSGVEMRSGSGQSERRETSQARQR